MWQRLKYLLRKEFIQIIRDPRMRMIVFVAPLVQMMLFSYAFTTDVRNIRTVVLDYDHSALSRELVNRFEYSGFFRVVAYLDGPSAAEAWLDSGQAQCLVQFNSDFEGEIVAGRTAPLQVVVDGTDSNTSGIILQYTSAIVAGFTRDQLRQQASRLGGGLPGQIVIARRSWFNPNLTSSFFYVPGLISMVLTLISVMLTALAIVRETELGTIEQIMVTPIRPLELILGKTLPFAIIGMIVITVMLVIARLVFGVPFQGSIAVLYAGAVFFLFSTLSIGLFISTISTSQQQAMLGAFLFIMPASLLSGFIFPISNMPWVVQLASYLTPMRYFLIIIRGVTLKGAGFDVLWPQFLGLTLLGLGVTLVAASRFKKTTG